MTTQIPLDELEKHAAALGRLLGHWAFLEQTLINVLGCLLGINQLKSRLIWQQFNSASSKIELLERLNQPFVLANPSLNSFREELDNLLTEAGTLNRMRNAYIHAIWAGPEGDRLTRISNSLPGNTAVFGKKPEHFTPSRIQDDVIRIAKLSESLTHWQLRYQKARQAQNEQ